MSSQLSESAKEAAKDVGSSVERLEKLFDKLYSDTFSIMRDTVSDMRKHIWPEPDQQEDKVTEEAEKRADEKIAVLKEDVQKQLSEVMVKQQTTDGRIKGLTRELNTMLDDVINKSRKVDTEAREEALRSIIIRRIKLLKSRKGVVKADDIVERLYDRYPGVIYELRKMRDEKVIEYSGELVPESEITLVD